MAGHSKWANIKHKKGKADAARGKVFSKIAKEIMVAASGGGGNPDDNIQLRALIQKAKGVSMPKDNIERAIKKGTGELEGGRLEEGSYEGYAVGGIAVVVKVLTDNKNRSASEVRHTFNKAGANMAEQGAVSRMFQRKGQIFIEKDGIGEEELMECVLESGAEDLKTEGAQYEVLSDPGDYDALSDALTEADITMASSEIVMIPDLITEVTDIDQARSILKFIDALEELDDVQDVYANFDISDEVAAALDCE
ncbi:MAG: YebC/PmpR family DNA-binding transcriptional regulator [Rhodospirillales bacterium]|nr:YebC/PmpR family DNA-binding transcriptional regulator [Kiritimatiellaceae bacterium]